MADPKPVQDLWEVLAQLDQDAEADEVYRDLRKHGCFDRKKKVRRCLTFPLPLV